MSRHCERSEAIQSGVHSVCAALDCFVASLLAMTILYQRFASPNLKDKLAAEMARLAQTMSLGRVR
jgi:hypothetical protein